MCVMSKEAVREMNIGWNCADWKMITAKCNWSDLTKVVECVAVNFHGIVIAVHIFLSKIRMQTGYLGPPLGNLCSKV